MNNQPVYVIDCGSGSSRLSKYSYHNDGYIHEDLYIPSGIIPTLAIALSKDKQELFIEDLKNALEKLDSNISRPDYFSSMNLTIGATGGLRKALDEGIDVG